MRVLHALRVLVHVLDAFDDLVRHLVLELELEPGVEARLFAEDLRRQYGQGGRRSTNLRGTKRGVL